ncbi:MAG TPA: carboxypeptidase-like regulatory domain-containing protein [Solirubrobacteraceae bacterium]|nr:carboxypeptidase-like regulatory domain-containing protein [Solirubrobacteraceae bacterium]
MIPGRRILHAAGVVAALATSAGPAVAATEGTSGGASTAGAIVSGVLTQADGVRLPGMRVQAEALGAAPATCLPAAGCFATYTDPAGRYSLTGLAPATYELSVLDGARTVDVRAVTVTAGTGTVAAPLQLGPPAVPAGTVALHARRDLAWLRAERERDGVPARVVLNPRWSQECAAHDRYEAAAGVLTPSENPASPDASVGGAWAGLNSDLAEGRWTRGGTPWEEAPIHLLALLAPSLAVTGIDDSGRLQCAVTFPGMVRRWSGPDAVSTVPTRGQTGVTPSELPRESPFTPVRFVGLPASRPTGRELFVYLNRAGTIGQAPVRITRASLRARHHRVAVRWVDSATPTIGPYLAGGIIVPLRPLARRTWYRASVAVRDGARTITHRWRFRTL